MKKIVVLISGSGSNLQAIIDKCNSKYIQAEDGIRDVERSRGLGDVYKRQTSFTREVYRWVGFNNVFNTDDGGLCRESIFLIKE